MDKYLLQILLEVNTIIIPGLGAFTVVNKEKNEIMFMPYLKHDDGKLVNHIVSKDGLTENDARNLVSKYVRDILVQLDKGETYDMFKFGRFLKENGEIQFEAWDSYNKPASEKQVSKSEIKPIAQPTIDPVDTSIKTEVKPKVDEIKIEKKESKVIFDKEEKITETKIILDKKVEPKKEEVKEEPKLKTETIPVQEKTIQKTDEEAKDQTKTSEISVDNDLKKSKSPLKVILGVSLGLGVIASSVIYFSNKNESETNSKSLAKIEETIPVEKIEDQVSIDATIDTTFKEEEGEPKIQSEKKAETPIKVKETIKKEVKIEKKIEKPNKVNSKKEVEIKPEKIVQKVVKPTPIIENTSTSNGEYHVIIGSFGVEANANRLVAKSIKEGNNSKLLGKIKGVFVVSINSYATAKEANSAMRKANINGYVMKYSGN